jgi:dephospho-CoA kinase
VSTLGSFRSRPGVLLVGLTGGIATGKSTVTGMLRELGAAVLDADAVVYDLLEPGGDAVEAIVETFGPRFRGQGGGIDRAALAELVFDDEGQRERLERIVHPLVQEESGRRLEAMAASGAKILLYDAALLVETGRHREFDRLVVVVTRPEIQLARLMERDRLDPDAAAARVRSQLPLEQKVAVADYVIDNSGPWHATRRRVAEVHRRLEQDLRAKRTDGPGTRPDRGEEG